MHTVTQATVDPLREKSTLLDCHYYKQKSIGIKTILLCLQLEIRQPVYVVIYSHLRAKMFAEQRQFIYCSSILSPWVLIPSWGSNWQLPHSAEKCFYDLTSSCCAIFLPPFVLCFVMHSPAM